MNDDTYVHEPEGAGADTGGDQPDAGDSDDGGLDDRQGWLVVGVLAFCFVVAPVVVLLRPPAFLGFRDAYLVVAMVPGLILGVAALWAAAKA